MGNKKRLAQQGKNEQSIASLLSGGVVFTFLWATLLAVGVGAILGIFAARFIAAWQAYEIYTPIKEGFAEPLYNHDDEEVADLAEIYAANDLIHTMVITDQDGKVVYELSRDQVYYPINYSDTILFKGKPVGSIEFVFENNYLKNFGFILLWVILLIVFVNFISLLLTTGYLFRIYLRKPVQQVISVVNAFNEGRYEISTPVTQYIEFEPIISLIVRLGTRITEQMNDLRAAEEKYRSMFDHGVIGIFQSTLDGHFSNLNPVLAEMLGYSSPKEAIESIYDLKSQVYVNPADRENLIEEIQQTDHVINTLVNLKRANGEHFVANMSLRSVRNRQGDVEFLEGFIEDFTNHQRVLDELTQYRLYLEELVQKRTEDLSRQNAELQHEIAERKVIEEALRKSEERYRLLADNASDVIWMIDPKGKVIYVSPSVYQLRGFTPEEVMSHSLDEGMASPSARLAQRMINRLLRTGEDNNIGSFREVLELELTCKDGTTIWTETRLSRMFDTQDRYIGLLGVTRDISEKKKAREKLRKLAITDALTGIYNRGHFYEMASLELQRTRRYHRQLSVIMFDIDGFKQINDTYGHFAGDEVLRSLTRLCNHVLRENDIFARFGGDEFVIMLPETDIKESAAVATRLQQEVEHMVVHHEEALIKITISLGTTSVPDGQMYKVDQLLNMADHALYQAKQQGRNQVVALPYNSEATHSIDM